MSEPKIALGAIYITPGAQAEFGDEREKYVTLLSKHQQGEWGDLCPDDKTANDHAVVTGSRVLSAYLLESGKRVWIITEAGREATTILLPEEY